MDGQNWTPQVLRKSGGGAHMSQADRDAAVSRAVRAGTAVSERKFGATENKSTGVPAGPGHARKLEEDTEHFAHATVSSELKLAIQQARLAKKLSQKDLAALVACKATIINDYEAGRAIPDPQLLSKLERVLGVRLPRQKK